MGRIGSVDGMGIGLLAGLGGWAAGVTVAAAQPSVPEGFSVRLIQQTPGAVVPQLSAVDSEVFGQGVVTASTSSGVTTFRLLGPTGIIEPLGTFADPSVDFVQRVRFDSDGVLPNELHAALIIGDNFGPPFGNTTVYVTGDAKGVFSERWRLGNSNENRAYDFSFTDGSAGNPIGIVLLDADADDGTSLAVMGSDYAPVQVQNDSVPPGRSDTDVVGFALDVTGLYGGGLLLADTDANSDELTAIYELRDTASGGVYRAIAGPVDSDSRQYGDLGIVAAGPFGGVIYVTETLTDEIQQVSPDGMHTTWATGFVGVDSLSITPDGGSMYVADTNGVWLIRPLGSEPGPALVAHDPSASGGTALCGDPVASVRLIFSEPVSFTAGDVTVLDGNGNPVGFDASGSGSAFMILGLASPLEADTYTVTVADTLVSVATGQALDGDSDGVAGGQAQVSLTHRCPADPAPPYGLLDLTDITTFIEAFTGGCE